MIVLLVVLTIIVFILVDTLIRIALKRTANAKVRKQREEALDMGLKLEFAQEAQSLKRVEVDEPKARILAVDDEEVILDSFRKILVLEGYSIDTVISGPEALTLLKQHDYDFLFTDLRMPEMDGVDVAKAAKHLRPDMDVIIITGYASIESAVETMKHGAMDYVQKPFTDTELVEFVNKCLIRREDRIEKQIRPKIRLVTPSVGATDSRHEFNVPAGLFVTKGHSWVGIEPDGVVRIGLDDFAYKILEGLEGVELPEKGKKIAKGDALFKIKSKSNVVSIPSPVTGSVYAVNDSYNDFPELVQLKPYEKGWVCRIAATDLAKELKELKIGTAATDWYQKEIDRYLEIIKKAGSDHAEVHEADIIDAELQEKLLKTFFDN